MKPEHGAAEGRPMSGGGGGRLGRWLVRLAGGLFLVSLLLPAARLGGPRPAIGILAAFYASAAVPAAVVAVGAGPRAALAAPVSTLYAVAVAVFFWGLLAADVLLLVVAVRAAAGPRARRLAVAAALLVWVVPLLDYERLYAALGLTGRDPVQLLSGYYVWAASFAVLAAGAWRLSRPARAAGPG
jgi:hypothetical protein